VLIPVIALVLGVFFLGAGIYSSAIKDFSPKLFYGGIGLIALCLAALL
jgi:hypothetical protein